MVGKLPGDGERRRERVRVSKTKPMAFHDVAAMLEKESCVLCSFLKRFQSSCVVGGTIQGVQALCSFHTWAIAGGAESGRAAEILLGLLQKRNLAEGEKPAARCDICERIGKEEARLSQDFGELLGDLQFRQWLRDFGALCLPHASRLLRYLGEADREVVLAVVRKAADQLKDDLSAIVAEHSARRRAPEVVSRAAEFLEGRRGLG